MATEQNQKLANYYKELPQGFNESYCINAKKTSVGVLLNAIGLIVTVAVIVVCYLAKFGVTVYNVYEENPLILLAAVLALLISAIVYVIVHELTHGAVYKLFTRQKLRFGLKLTVAYCGLREGFVNKVTSLTATLAPFVLHSIWMIIAIIFIPAGVWALVMILLFAIHFGGCVGDLWVTYILLVKYARKAVLVSDDGPCQRFYSYSPEAAEEVEAVATVQETEAVTSAEETEDIDGD